MRFLLPSAAAVLAAIALPACAPSDQPRVYKVAIDVSPIQTLNDPQCFKGNNPNQSTIIKDQNYRQEATWVVWDAAGGRQYLDMGSNTFTLADAPPIHVNAVIEGAQNVFSATRMEQDRAGIIELMTTNVVTTLTDLNATPTGTIQLDAEYQCQAGTQACPSEPTKRSCSTTLNFWARKLEVQETADYSPVGTGISASTR